MHLPLMVTWDYKKKINKKTLRDFRIHNRIRLEISLPNYFQNYFLRRGQY